MREVNTKMFGMAEYSTSSYYYVTRRRGYYMYMYSSGRSARGTRVA